jgi:hypothetical protein
MKAGKTDRKAGSKQIGRQAVKKVRGYAGRG